MSAKAKNEFRKAYLAWFKAGHKGTEPARPEDLSVMGAQSVRAEVSKGMALLSAAGGATYSAVTASPDTQCDWCDGDAVVLVTGRHVRGDTWLTRDRMCWYHFDKSHPDLVVSV